VRCINSDLECQQNNPRPFSCYASPQNDIWSLGVVLVNLSCGRNPWKRASTEDSTFRAYLKDPEFLRTILPLSSELNVILRRIFECDPLKRITIPELRRLILDCPRFTAPPRSLSVRSKLSRVEDPFKFVDYCQFLPSPPAEPLDTQYSDSAISDTSLTDNETISTLSSSSEYPSEIHTGGFTYVDPEMPPEFWAYPFLLNDVAEKSLVQCLPAGPYVAVY
jgi:serine/threonine protein kinase